MNPQKCILCCNCQILEKKTFFWKCFWLDSILSSYIRSQKYRTMLRFNIQKARLLSKGSVRGGGGMGPSTKDAKLIFSGRALVSPPLS